MSATVAEAGIWTFDDFVEGERIGSIDIVVDQRRLALWHGIYSANSVDNDRIPQGLLTAATMEAYLRVIPKRPPGNVHAGQKLSFSDQPVTPGARLRFDFFCLGREIRKERRWISLGLRCTWDGQPVLEGQITTIWAR